MIRQEGGGGGGEVRRPGWSWTGVAAWEAGGVATEEAGGGVKGMQAKRSVEAAAARRAELSNGELIL